MINIIINKLRAPLRRSMAHYEHLQEYPDEWGKQLVRMDMITTELQPRDKHDCQDASKDRNEKRTFKHRIQLKAGSGEKKKFSSNKREFVPPDRIACRKQESRCLKCGRKNQQASDCECGCASETPPLKDNRNPNQEPVNKKARTDKQHLRIIQLGFEVDSVNE